jgi:hypothetical protein
MVAVEPDERVWRRNRGDADRVISRFSSTNLRPGEAYTRRRYL